MTLERTTTRTFERRTSTRRGPERDRRDDAQPRRRHSYAAADDSFDRRGRRNDGGGHQSQRLQEPRSRSYARNDGRGHHEHSQEIHYTRERSGRPRDGRDDSSMHVSIHREGPRRKNRETSVHISRETRESGRRHASRKEPSLFESVPRFISTVIEVLSSRKGGKKSSTRVRHERTRYYNR